MTFGHRFIAVLALVTGTACAPAQQESAGSPRPASTATAQPAAASTEPPTRKAILEALLANLDVPLSVHASCSGVGTEADDKTIGEYVSGFLAEFSADEPRNWIQTSVSSATSTAGEPVWRADVMLRHAAGEDEWGWGVRFDIRKSDSRVLPQSFQCLGAG